MRPYQSLEKSTSFHSILTTDGIELQGLLFSDYQNDPVTAILHIHGLAGNFYENTFIFSEASKLIDSNISMFSFNNRGHDYISDLNKYSEQSVETIKGGGAFEIFNECIFDIDAAINFLEDLGYKKILIQGHSSGCNKIMYYCKTKPFPSIVKGIVLLSPCDDVGMVIGSLEDKYNNTLQTAKDFKESGKGDEIMPGNPFFGYPMSASVFIDMATDGGEHDIFCYRKENNPLKQIIDKPILTIFGGEQDYLTVPLELARNFIADFTSSDLHIHQIDNSGHSYQGFEDVLISIILNWTETIF